MASQVYGCVLRYIDDPEECSQSDVDSIKRHLIEHIPHVYGLQVNDLGICMRPPCHPREVCDGTSEDTLPLVVHYHNGDCGQGVGIDPDGFVYHSEPFDPRFLGPVRRLLDVHVASSFLDVDRLVSELKCDGCGRGFHPDDIVFTDEIETDMCGSCYPQYSDELQRTTAYERAQTERMQRIHLLRGAHSTDEVEPMRASNGTVSS
ncbi:MAG: hypothetical protein CBC65_001095 [Rhodothermaceae bacterium TMED105]|jgi:hypothetical protein|nr:MAG: hypothetical protein CBC65_001095 [Rhodothermaceae bacterium TMED105]|tara:strand:- start:2136 stop:2750 length:615 start_codon:yes stop_codon:yes gene_type:complete